MANWELVMENRAEVIIIILSTLFPRLLGHDITNHQSPIPSSEFPITP